MELVKVCKDLYGNVMVLFKGIPLVTLKKTMYSLT
jgi:hypothetical protein